MADDGSVEQEGSPIPRELEELMGDFRQRQQVAEKAIVPGTPPAFDAMVGSVAHMYGLDILTATERAITHNSPKNPTLIPLSNSSDEFFTKARYLAKMGSETTNDNQILANVRMARVYGIQQLWENLTVLENGLAQTVNEEDLERVTKGDPAAKKTFLDDGIVIGDGYIVNSRIPDVGLFYTPKQTTGLPDRPSEAKVEYTFTGVIAHPPKPPTAPSNPGGPAGPGK